MRKIVSSLFAKYMLIFIGIMLLTSIVSPFLVIIIFHSEFIGDRVLIENMRELPLIFAFRMGLFSILIGTIFITITTKIVTKPIKELSSAAEKVSQGDLSIKIEQKSKYDEVAILTSNFNLMVKQLSKNEYLHKDFVSNVSHEFKTPIAAIEGYAELLSTPFLVEEKRIEYSEIIIRQTKRLAKLSSDLLRLSQLENSELSIKMEQFSLDEQIRDVIILLQNEWEEKNIQLDLKLEEVKFQGDKTLVYQIWVNVIGNAIKFTQDNGRIKIRVYEKEKIYIEIEDNGIGMTKEEVERIFERFYKVDSSRSSRGTGLGLSITKKIVEIHGGEIKIETIPNKGTKFLLSL